MRRLWRRSMRLFLWVSGLLLLSATIVQPVQADGGAPQLAYIAGGGTGLSIIDIAQRRLSKTLNLAGQPQMLLLSPDGARLYVAQPDLGRLLILAARTEQALCTASIPGRPSWLALSIDASVLYVAGPEDTSVRAVNPQTCAIERRFETHQPIYGLAVAASPAANATPETPNQIWASGTNALSIFDATGTSLGSISLAAGPQSLSIPAGFTAYVTTRQGGVLAVDLNSRRVLRALLPPGQYGPMDYDALTGEVYVPDVQARDLDILTPVTAGMSTLPAEPERRWSLAGVPVSIAITNDGQLGFVALADGRVQMLDIPGRSVITTISVGGTPRFIITGVYPPASVAPLSGATSSGASSSFPGLLTLFAVLLLLLCLALIAYLWRQNREKRGS